MMVTKSIPGKRFTMWLIVGLAVIAVFGFYAGQMAYTRLNDQFVARDTLSVRLASQSLQSSLRLPASHLYSVAALEPRMRQAISARQPDLDEVANAFTTLLMRNPDYAQVRWINEDGMEIVRIDQFSPANVQRVASNDLQDKSRRPYVQSGLQLGPSELYVSPLDLNVENGVVQRPFVPVVRMALRLIDGTGIPRGILVLNISAKPMLDRIISYSVDENIMLLNADGFWLKSPNPADEWGFMLGKSETLGTRNPKAWQNINSARNGHVETAVGHWTWDTIGVSESHLTVAENLSLKLVAHVQAETIWASRMKALTPVMITTLLTALLFGFGLHRILREMAERRRAEKQAIIANKTKNAFLATMSHEIRTPMTGILGFADMLLEDRLSDDSKTKVGKIKSAAEALLRILNDILDISKLDAGKFEIESIPFNPASMANEVVQMFYHTCPAEKKETLQITAKVAKGFPEAVSADPTRLRQVLMNLLGNAVKFSDRGSVTLVCAHDPAKKQLEFEVIDTGIGMDQELLDRLFQEFQQADASTSRKYHGTGLGLAICKKLVDRMGGEIRVKSTPGLGSAFWFSVPYEPASIEDLPMEEAAAEPAETARQALSILVAEDNEINQMIIQNTLKKMGHKATIAESGMEALRLVSEEHDFDLILMDVRMPEMSGTEATRRIRALPGAKSRILIIALTADVMAENKASYFEAGMNDCVGKPINHVELAAAINKAACSVSR